MENSSKNLVKSTLVVTATIFAVLICIAILICFSRGISKEIKFAREEPLIRTKITLLMLREAVEMFTMDTGRYPMSLSELIEQPTDVTGWDPQGYLLTTELPKDAWGLDFAYKLNFENGVPFVIISYGADREESGNGYDADIYSTDIELIYADEKVEATHQVYEEWADLQNSLNNSLRDTRQAIEDIGKSDELKAYEERLRQIDKVYSKRKK